MRVSIERLRAIVDAGEARGEWPGQSAAILGAFQGDYDWAEETAEAIHAVLAGDAEELELAQLLPHADEQIWTEWYPQYYGPHLFFVANLLKAARVAEPELAELQSMKEGARVFEGSLKVVGDFEAEGRILVCGNLRIQGNATFRDELVVIGDLEVDERLLLANNWTPTAIVGDVRVGGAMLIRSDTYVSGNVRAENVFIDNPDWVGSLQVCGDLDTGMLVEAISPDERSQVHGALRLTEPDAANAIDLIAAAFEGV